MKKAYLILFLLLFIAFYLLLSSPIGYSSYYCLLSFGVFLLAMGITLINNILYNRSIVLFETAFSFSFLFMNYIYPVFLYQINPYFSIFIYGFNEDIMTKCTALATVGYVSFCVGIFEKGNGIHKVPNKSSFKLHPLNYLDVGILLILYLLFLYTNLDALRQGITMDGSGGFFFIFALFYVYKYFVFSRGKTPLFGVISFWFLIVLYILTNFVLGNRGEPLYLVIAILICYHNYVRHVPFIKLFVITLLALFVFYFVGKTRISENQQGKTSREDRIESWESEENVFMYATELIINNRALFALVDYTDSHSYSYGETWGANFFSTIPFGQSFALNVIGMEPNLFSTTNLNTSLVFSEGDPNRFGLGTNLIGDIYVSFGSIGVLLLMFLLGRFVKNIHKWSLQGPSYYQLLYVLFMVFSIYYPRASLFIPMQAAAWNYVLCYISKKR